MLFELSRDYKKAFELIKKGDRIVGWTYLTSKQSIEAWLSEAQQNINLGCVWINKEQAKTSEMFERECSRLNVEFFLPCDPDTIPTTDGTVEDKDEFAPDDTFLSYDFSRDLP